MCQEMCISHYTCVSHKQTGICHMSRVTVFCNKALHKSVDHIIKIDMLFVIFIIVSMPSLCDPNSSMSGSYSHESFKEMMIYFGQRQTRDRHLTSQHDKIKLEIQVIESISK